MKAIFSNVVLTITFAFLLVPVAFIANALLNSFLKPISFEKLNCELDEDVFITSYFGEPLKFKSKYISACETIDNSSGLEPPLTTIQLEFKLPDFKPLEDSKSGKKDVLFVKLSGFEKKYASEIVSKNDLEYKCDSNDSNDGMCCSNTQIIRNNLFYNYCFEYKYMKVNSDIDLKISNFMQNLKVNK